MFKHYSVKGFDNSTHLVVLVTELLPLYSIPNRTYSPTSKDSDDGVLCALSVWCFVHFFISLTTF